MDAGADEVPEAPLALVSGMVVMTDGAVLAGVAAEGGMALVLGLVLVLVFSFLPQAPSASKAEKATTVAATRVVGDIKRIENLLEVVGHWRQQKVGSLNKRFEKLWKRSIDALSKTTGVALDGRPAPPGPASAAV